MEADKIAEIINLSTEMGAKQLVNFYDKWYLEDSYDQALKDAGYKGPITIASILSKRIEDKTGKILDVGAGTGVVGEELAKKGFSNIYAVDPSKESVNICSKKSYFKEVIHSFVGPAQLPFEDNTFAGAGSSGVFLTGHCDGTSLREVVRLVKPGGTIVITTRRTFYDDHHDNYNLRAVSDELVAAKKCSLVLEDIPAYSQGRMGVAMIYTVL